MTAMRAWLVTASIVAHVAIIRLASGFWHIERLKAEPPIANIAVMLPLRPLTQPIPRDELKPVMHCSGCVCNIARWQRIEKVPEIPQPHEEPICIRVMGRNLCLPPWDTPAMPPVGGR
jgi:hypothetical protein